MAAPAASTPTLNEPDQSWSRLYLFGGASAILYVVTAVIVPAVMAFSVGDLEAEMTDGRTVLPFIADHKVYWHFLHGLVLESSILLIVAFVALYVSLRHLDRSMAAIGAALAITSQVLFMAYYPVLLGLVQLSDQYLTAGPERRVELATAADALLAQNRAFNPVYEVLMAAGVLVFSLVMMKGVLPRLVAYLGVATFAASVVGLALYPVVGVAYLWWWIVLNVWLVAVGWNLLALGRRRGGTGP